MMEIKIFFFVLSILFLLKNLAVFVIKILQTDPKPMIITRIETILMYLSFSYILTFIFS